MPRLAAVALLALAVPLADAAPPPKADDELVVRVQKGIAKGVQYLTAKQNPKTGTWEGLVTTYLADQKGGATALCTLALLNCGVKPDDPSVSRAIRYLEDLPPEKTYVVGLQNMVFAETRQAKYLPKIQANVEWLLAKAIRLNGKLEGWGYPGGSPTGDNSNTQYALLGLYAGKQAGARIDDATWDEIRNYYTRTQAKPGSASPGSWPYHNTPFGDTAPSFTMSVAGVCGLVIARMGLDRSEQGLDETTGVAANCGVYPGDDAVARGLNYIAARFNFEQGKSVFYNVYGLERLGRLSGQRFVGRFDWYREGCEFLLRQQNTDGAFARQSSIDSVEFVSTAFSLLFLSKGRTPVVLTKLAWGDFQDGGGNGTFREVPGRRGEVNWNRKHNDARHLTEYASGELFKGHPLAWQVYDVRRRDLSRQEEVLNEVGVLVQSPVVYLNGHGSPAAHMPTGEKDILKRYVEEGGFIFAEACCGDEQFTRGFRGLMADLFPDSPLRKVPPEHAIWRSFADVSPTDFPDLECMERGCKTVVVFSPKPLAGYWEERRFLPPTGKDRAARNGGERAFKLAGNVIAYATGMELPKPRGTVLRLAKEASTDKAPPRGYTKPAQLKIPGADSEPAPAALRNLMAHLRDTTRLDVRLEKELFYPGDEALSKFRFMYLHGRKGFDAKNLDVDVLQANLQMGGLLLADAACGRKEFDASFRELMARMFPDSKLQVIPGNDPLYSAKVNGVEITTVRCRREKDGGGAEAEMRTYSPHLEGIKIDGRWVVVYSKYDLGCAMEGHKSSDCLGHDKESALKLAGAAVLYVLKR